MSNPMSPVEYSVLASDTSSYLGIIQNLNLNFSGYPLNNESCIFSMGGWLRLTKTEVPQVVFQALLQFELLIDENGSLIATFLDDTNNTSIKSLSKIDDSNWHFVAVSFDSSSEEGKLTVFVDGLPTTKSTNVSGTFKNSSYCTIGGPSKSKYIEVASWEIWKKALPDKLLEIPKWGVPGTMSPDYEGLVVAFDFASKNITSSNPNVSFSEYGRKKVIPCLYMNNGGVANFIPEKVFPVGNSGPWSFLTWVKVPENQDYLFVILNSLDEQNHYGDINIAINSTSTNIEARNTNNVSIFGTINVSHDFTVWTHLSLTYDNSRVRLYLNGILSFTSDEVTFDSIRTYSSMVWLDYVFAKENWIGSVQCTSFWNRALSVENIENCTGLLNPETPGLVAFFPFLFDTKDVVDKVLLNVTNGSIQYDEQIQANEGIDIFNVKARIKFKETLGDRILESRDYWNLAKNNGITIENRKLKNGKPDYEELHKLYNNSFFSIDDHYRPMIIEEFDKNYRLGKELISRGIKTGRIIQEDDGQYTYFNYHTLNGPVEVYRTNGFSTHQNWIVQCIIDGFLVGFALLGIFISATGMRLVLNGSNRMGIILNNVGGQLNNVNNNDSGVLKVVRIIVDGLIAGTSVFSLVWDVLRWIGTSWWSLAFLIINLVLSFLAMISPAGIAIYGVRIASAGAAVAALIVGIENEPPVAKAEGTPLSGNAPLQVNFTGNNSVKTKHEIESYNWEFGDGETSSEENPNYTYNNAGNFQVKLTVIDNQGGQDIATLNVTVN